MLKSLRTLLLVFMSFMASGTHAAALEFNQATFDALQKEGKPTLVMIHADWCPTCKAQDPILSELLNSPNFKNLNFMRVDFDKQQAVVKKLKATMQSTLIVFKGGQEVGRSTGDTSKENIAALLKKAI